MQSLDPISQLKRDVKPPFEKSDFRIFVFGPYLTEGDIVDEPSGDERDLNVWAKYLRYYTKKSLIENGYTVDLGETEEVLDYYNRCFGASDCANAEIHHADRGCNAIVIFPSSIGAICELGLFAPINKIAKKTLSIVDQCFENSDSFFRKGLIEMYESENGTAKFLPYSSVEICKDAAMKFVDQKFSGMIRLNSQVKFSRACNE